MKDFPFQGLMQPKSVKNGCSHTCPSQSRIRRGSGESGIAAAAQDEDAQGVYPAVPGWAAATSPPHTPDPLPHTQPLIIN